MKKALMFLFSFALVFGLMSSMAFAVDESQHYDFQVRVNGETSVTANVGDEVTVNVVLKGNPSPFQIYAIQDELVYDTTCLKLVEGSNATAPDFRFSTRPMSNGIAQMPKERIKNQNVDIRRPVRSSQFVTPSISK